MPKKEIDGLTVLIDRLICVGFEDCVTAAPAAFVMDGDGREMAMLTNPMETQLVSSLGVQIGGRSVPEQPMELVRTSLADGRADAFEQPASPPVGIGGDVPLTPARMDGARSDLGLEGM